MPVSFKIYGIVPMRLSFLLLVLSLGYAEDQLFVILSRDVDGFITEVSVPVDPVTLTFTMGSKMRCSHAQGDGTFVDKVGIMLSGTIMRMKDEAGNPEFSVRADVGFNEVTFKEYSARASGKKDVVFLPNAAKTNLNFSDFLKLNEVKVIGGMARNKEVIDRNGERTSSTINESISLKIQNKDIY